jgi:histone H3/H4
MKIDQATSQMVSELLAQVEPRIHGVKTLEDAAQELVAALQEKFDESVVIARAFVTVPYGGLPPKNKEFVQKLAESAGAAADLKPATPVLSLIGTYGQETDWRDRRKSKGHVGIPLISSSFVGAIPMISRLLKELGVPMTWVDSHDTEIIAKTMDPSGGLFFVENAAEATDHEGRKIIAAQDFVSAHSIKSVFGTGGVYSGGQIVVIVAFCRGAFTKATAERFLELNSWFRNKTGSFVRETKIFAEA